MFVNGDKLENGHYSVLKELGHGGMGVVYHCHDELLQRDVAIKMLLPELMTNQDTVETFHQEARLAAQLEHPNIVTIYDIGKEERKGKSHHYIAMEYLPGGNLAGRVAHADLSVEHRLNWMKQLATGLSFAHKRGVVHQDIKADNIFITEEGDLKIGDFGLARIAVGRARNRSVSGMGTPAYMSPELCRGEQQDHRSDIYSMGVLFYEVAAGELPFRAKGMIEMAMKHASAPVPSPRKVNPQIPEALDKLIQKMMSKLADDRYQAMTDVIAVLDDLIFEQRLARLGLSPKGRAIPKGAGGTGFFPEPDKQPVEPPRNGPPGSTVRQPPADVAFTAAPPGTISGAPSAKAPGPPQDAPYRPESQKPVQKPSTAAQAPVTPTAKEPYPSADSRASRPVQPAVPAEIKLAWSFATKGPIGWNSGPVTSRDGALIFVNSGDGRVYALDSATGKKAWTFDTNAPLLASPVVAGDKLIVAGADGSLYALSTMHGLTEWRFPLTSPCVSTPGLVQDTALVATMGGQVVAVDAQTGFLRWQVEVGSPIVSSPQHHGNVVVFATREGDVVCVSALNGHVHWKTPVGHSLVASPMASSDSVYVGSQAGVFHALDINTGRIIWEYESERPIVGRGVFVFTSVIFAGQDRWICCCDKYDGRLMWKAPVRGTVWSNLVAVAGAVHAVTREGWVQSFAHRTGELRWQVDTKHRLESAPCLGGNRLYVGTIEGEVLAYSLSKEMVKLAG